MAEKTKIAPSKTVKPAAKPKTAAKTKKDSGKAWKRFKRRFTLFILLVLCGTAFYMGWTQPKVPEGEGLILHSRIEAANMPGGYYPRIVQSGEFLWIWQGIFPTIVTTHRVPLQYRTVSAERSGELPSGSIYLEHSDIEANFNYRIEIQMQYRLKESALLDQVIAGRLNPEGIEEYYLQTDQNLLSFILNYQLGRMLLSSDDPTVPTEIPLDWSEVAKAAEKEFPQLEFAGIEPVIFEIPDFQLYDELRKIYFDYLEEKNQQLIEVAREIENREALIEERLQMLEEYGKLITQYPLLLDFIAMDKGENWTQFSPEELLIP